MRFLLHFLGALWCLPATIIVWLVYILPMWLVFNDLTFERWDGPFIARFSVNTRNPRMIGWHRSQWNSWGGVGLPCAYVYRDEPWLSAWKETFCRHEKRHCMQWFVLGILFPLVYGIGMLIGLARGDTHGENPLEIDAERAE